MPRKATAQRLHNQAALSRQGKAHKRLTLVQSADIIKISSVDDANDSDSSVCCWDGSINHSQSTDDESDSHYEFSTSSDEADTDGSTSDLRLPFSLEVIVFSAPTNSSNFDPDLAPFLPERTFQRMGSPRISEFLRSNEGPLDKERKEFIEALAANRDIAGILQSKIVATQRLLDFLKDQKSIAESNKADTAEILRQTRILNSDCLINIFQQCLDEQSGDCDKEIHPFGPPDGADCLNPVRRAPWSLSQVCHRWREVALDSPRLWSCIDIDFGVNYKTYEFYSRCLFRLGLFLERSRGYRLRIRLRSRWDISVNPIFVTLLPTSSRWIEAFFSLPFKSYHSLSAYRAFFSRLERLQASLAGPTELGLNTFGMAHNIHTFTTDIARPFLVFSDFPAGASVKSYSALGGSFREQVSALTYLPNVQDLVLLCEKSNMDIPSPVTLLHVQSLHVHEIFSSGGVARTLNNLALPSLRNLRMTLIGITEAPSFPIQHHLDHIMTLELSCRLSHSEDIDAFCKFLAPLTLLETLSIHSQRISDVLIHRLVMRSGSDQIVRYVPRLRCLDLRSSTFADERRGNENLLRMVESRRNVKEDAEELKEICFDRPVDPQLSRIWEPLRKQGLRINY
ncbi:hypothetical protein IW261DRAFT_1571296 [Armillaria novae-zelandiae]|uniref:F-box domain-containing protein n=1 Tax=Armillaria novae-zelandiae TaxID=153914 RepID=A0AA39UAY2_9AGAR|nr:hypothetical protein IW261DRAFT_1571296 [Armillaria novae-zelandiae]